MQQPIRAGVQEQPELVGFPVVALRAVGPGVELVLLDHVFHSAAGAINLLIELLGPAGQIGDDEAYVEAFRCSLDAGHCERKLATRGALIEEWFGSTLGRM
jgi:hypothetical protein